MDFSGIIDIDLWVMQVLAGPHSLFSDGLAVTLTNGLTWIPMYLAMLFVVIKNSETMQQIGLVLLISAFLIIYISNRYVCQKKMVEISKMEKKMEQTKYKSTVYSSMLTEESRESNIMDLLKSYGDTTLQVPNDPPYLIRVEE